MKFKSDQHRKAVFANMFKGSDSKLYKVNSKNIKNTNFKSDFKPEKIKTNLQNIRISGQKVSLSETKSRNYETRKYLKDANPSDIKIILNDHIVQGLIVNWIRKYYRIEGIEDQVLEYAKYNPKIEQKLKRHYKYYFLKRFPNVKSLKEFKKLSDQQYDEVRDIIDDRGPHYDTEYQSIAGNVPKDVLKKLNERVRALGYKDLKSYQIG